MLRLSRPLASSTRAPCQRHHNSTRPRYAQTRWRGRSIADSQPPTRVRSLVTQHNRKRTVIRQSPLQTSIGKTITATARPHVTVSNIVTVAEQHITIEGKQRTSGNLAQPRFNDATAGECHHATRHDSEATGRYAAYAPTRKRLNTPTTAHSSSTTRHARENPPAHAADGLASAKCALGGAGVRKAARRAYSESTVSSAPSATSPTPPLSAASTLALDTSTRSTPARSASTTPTVAAHAWHYTAMSAATFTPSALLAYIATEAICKCVRGRNTPTPNTPTSAKHLHV